MKLKQSTIILMGCLTCIGAIPMKMTITLNNDSLIVKELSEIDEIGFGDLPTAITNSTISTFKPSLRAVKNRIQLTGASSQSFGLKLYDLKGREVFNTNGNFSQAGSALINTPRLASSIYIARFTTGSKTFIHRISLMK